MGRAIAGFLRPVLLPDVAAAADELAMADGMDEMASRAMMLDESIADRLARHPSIIRRTRGDRENSVVSDP